jgi:multidrug transporter EmrE-like cation transporter
VGVIVLGEPKTIWRLVSIALIVAGIAGLKLASGSSAS